MFCYNMDLWLFPNQMFRECPGRERPTYINLSSSESKWDFLKGVTAYANWGKKNSYSQSFSEILVRL